MKNGCLKVSPKRGSDRPRSELKSKIAKLISALLFAALGTSIAKFILDSKLLSALGESTMLWLPVVLYISCALVFGVIGFLLAPALMKAYHFLISSLMRRFSDMPLSKIFVGVIGLIIALVLAYLLSFLPLRIQPQFIGTALCVLMYIIFATLGWMIPTKRFKELSLPSWLRSSEKGERGKRSTASAKVIDTSSIIDGRFFDVLKTGIIEGTIIVPQFVLDELRYIADSSDPLKRARGRRGLDILNDIRKTEDGQNIIVTDVDYPELEDVDSKLMRLASEKHACIVTNDYNLNKAASVHRIKVFNINDLANALRTNVTAGEEIRVSIVKEGKELTQGVAYLDDGTMVVVEGARELIGSTIEATVTSVLQTSAGKMIFAKVKE